MWESIRHLDSATLLALLKIIVRVLTSCGAFIVGINLMTKGFINLSANKKSTLFRMFRSKNRVGGIVAGTVHSALTQSSDATSVYVIRLSDIAVITLFQACCAIIGANIGTTITNFLVSLSEFHVAPYFAFFTFVGAIPLLVGKGRFKIFGEIVAGFGIMFMGIELLGLYSQDPLFTKALTKIIDLCSDKYVLLATGFILTAILQSSSVVTSLVIFFVGSTSLSLEGAFFLVAGANVGTCITSFIASAKSSANAKRTSLFHLMFNIIGAGVFVLIMFFFEPQIMGYVNTLSIPPKFIVAIFTLLFNVGAAILILPFIKPLVALTQKLIRND